MRPVPGTGPADARQGLDSLDALAGAASTTSSIDCFITTEEALADSANDLHADVASLRSSRSRRKRSHESLGRPPRAQLPSPTPTAASIASLSSSMLSDLDMDVPGAPSPLAMPDTPAGHSRRASVGSSVSLGASSLAPSSPRRSERSSTPGSDGRSRRDGSPQLIMPSLAVPQRRPFSDTGKSVGKLKVLVAGQSGIGKASLIHAVAHCCEHIVHIDPMASTTHRDFSELWASTKPRPWWRGSMELSNQRMRRRSSTGEILERNLCFVVKSALQRSTSSTAERDYIDAHLSQLLKKPVDDPDLLALLSGGGASIVDAVFYMIPHTGLELRDIECIKSVQEKTNIIPLLARADELDQETISSAKELIRQQIDENGLDCFSFMTPNLEEMEETMDIFSVSSVTQTDYDVMDASVLMSSGYVQPLVSTDLSKLVENVFSPDGCSWLRHAAAVKCIQWRREQDQGLYLDMALTRRDPATRALTRVLTANPFMQYQNWGPIEVSDWAQGLRQSLFTEKTHRVTTHQQNTTSPTHRRQRSRDVARREMRRVCGRGGSHCQPQVNMTHQDPLGLLEMVSQLKIKGRMTAELLSSLGLIGLIATWVIGPARVCPPALRQLSKVIFATVRLC